MGKRKRWIPFGLWPANWGLEGDRRAQARAEYYLDNEDLDRALLDIWQRPDTHEHKLASLQLDHDYQKISAADFDYAELELRRDQEGVNYEMERLDLDLKWEKLTEREHRKARANLLDEPWFEVVDAEFLHRKDLGSAFNFQLDWNEKFIDQLVADGWAGATDAEIVDGWFSEACAQMFAEVDEDEAALSPSPVVFGPRTSVNRLDNGTSEYS